MIFAEVIQYFVREEDLGLKSKEIRTIKGGLESLPPGKKWLFKSLFTTISLILECLLWRRSEEKII